MLLWIIVLSIILIGLTLIIIELVFIPGTTVVGVIGVVLSIIGVVMSYNRFGNETGFYVLIGTLTVTGIALFYSFRSGAWSKLSHKSAITSRVNDNTALNLSIGDEGVARSALRPFGNAEFNSKMVEVKTSGNYVAEGKRIKIISIQSNQIVIEPLN